MSSERLQQQLMETDAETHSQRTSGHERVMWKPQGRIETASVVKDTTRRPTESTNLSPWGLTETELPTKEHAEPGPRSPHTFLNVHLGRYMDP